MDGLRTWIITIVSVTIISTIIEKFAPQGNLDKYVKLVCGLAVTLAITMPALNFINRELNIESVAWNEYVKLSEIEFQKRIDKLQRENSEQIIEVYRQSLIADIKSRFMGEGEFMVTNVDAVLFEDPEKNTFGMIRALYITLIPGTENRLKIISNETIDRIKNELSQVFSIEKDKVIIDSSSFNGGE